LPRSTRCWPGRTTPAGSNDGGGAPELRSGTRRHSPQSATENSLNRKPLNACADWRQRSSATAMPPDFRVGGSSSWSGVRECENDGLSWPHFGGVATGSNSGEWCEAPLRGARVRPKATQAPSSRHSRWMISQSHRLGVPAPHGCCVRAIAIIEGPETTIWHGQSRNEQPSVGENLLVPPI